MTKLRIGCVPFLNAKPLIYGLDEVVLLSPVALASKLHSGDLDVALVPTAEVLEHPEYYVINGPAIVSEGAVGSVLLFFRGDLDSLRTVYLDPVSKTSNALIQILLRGCLGLSSVKFIALHEKLPSEIGPNEAILVIGDRALQEAVTLHGTEILDLGLAWTRWTGKPFVYAVWAGKDREKMCNVKDILLRAKRGGLENMNEICEAQKVCSVDEAKSYLTNRIRYHLDSKAIEGFLSFQQVGIEWGLFPRMNPPQFL
ncbi:MAG: menaquinone biosynthesis protein [Verrucomicrobiota bacterium]|nr:menaquinone biosynthesis protein [Verrucomicrobiota bacterium]